ARGLRAPGPPVDLGLVAASTPAETAAAPGSTSGADVAAPTLEHSLKPAYGSFERPLKSGGGERTAHGPVHRGAHPDRSRPAVAADPGPRRALPLGPAVHRDPPAAPAARRAGAVPLRDARRPVRPDHRDRGERRRAGPAGRHPHLRAALRLRPPALPDRGGARLLALRPRSGRGALPDRLRLPPPLG